jgi:hypothetical protein
MTKQTAINFRRRINKALNASGSVIDLTLVLDIEKMSHTDKTELQMFLQLSTKPISFPYLDKKIKQYNLLQQHAERTS